MRLASVSGWREGIGAGSVNQNGQAALRHSDRLSERDRSLLHTYALYAQADPAGVDTVKAYLRRYPDDIEALYLLGDALFHGSSLTAVPPESIALAFDAVLRLDSSLTPALIHPAELALMYQDSAAFARYLSAMERSTGDQDPVGRAALRVVWGPHDAAGDGVIRTVIAQAQGSDIVSWRDVWAARYRDPRAGSDQVLQIPISSEQGHAPDDPQRLQAMQVHSLAASGLGRVTEGRRLADSLLRRDLRRGLIATTFPVLVGIAPRASIREVEVKVRALAHRPIPALVMVELALVSGDPAEARAAIACARSSDSVKARPVLGGLFEAAEGWAEVLEGDTASGIKRLAAGLQQPGVLNVDAPSLPLRLQWALALAARPATRAEGIRRLRYGFDLDPAVLPLTFYALGQAYEADGNRAEAARFYGSFLRLWDRADPELQPWVRRAKEAMGAESTGP
jgi:hypothetical protein